MVGQAVPGIVMRERAEERELVSLTGQGGQMLADLQPASRGVDRPEITAEFGGASGLRSKTSIVLMPPCR